MGWRLAWFPQQHATIFTDHRCVVHCNDMRAIYRLLRATFVFAIIFNSYLWAVSFAKLWPKRFASASHWDKIHRRNARRMYRAFVSLRGVYIKLGQILSIMGSFLPKQYTEELEGLLR